MLWCNNRFFNCSKCIYLISKGAWVICEPWFTGSRDLCELWKYVNQKSKFTEKSCEPDIQKFGSRTFFYSNNREPNFCEPKFF